MIVNYKIHEVSEYINWIYFFHAWGFQPKFAAIADIHGCDSCRAMWLTGFAEEGRPKASEAMQLFSLSDGYFFCTFPLPAYLHVLQDGFFLNIQPELFHSPEVPYQVLPSDSSYC